MQSGSRYKKLFSSFNKLNIMIIGDVMVDSYLWGKVERISPEAPIPIVSLKKRENRMGGAANVAMNIRSLGANPILCSVIGVDEKGDQFLDLMKKEKMSDAGIIRSVRRITTTKFRIFGNSYQMLRVDEEVDHDLVEGDYLTMVRVIDHLLKTRKIDCIIFQDYDKGVITPKLINHVVNSAAEYKIPVTVDPKRKNFIHYKDVTLFKPNLKELKDGMNMDADPGELLVLKEATRRLQEQLNCRYVLTTMSEKGVMISLREENEHSEIMVPAHPRLISDVSGAGDTVISVASLCLALQASPDEIANISNLAGGLVCEEVGVVPINKEKLLRELINLL
ncbi:MAG: D-glycero-beta-D-manno-heptose-7-phosphate kinase [Alphaproteobacteria bacterium]|nr:D-glycero-beta-D-manno-heptose-7-phosphate kinase [Alphaproteobacteria bacterium]